MEQSHFPKLGSDALSSLALRKYRSQSIIFKVLLAVTGTILLLLPLTKVTVYSTFPGMLEHATAPVPLKATASGSITFVRNENFSVRQGDTLVIIEHAAIAYNYHEVIREIATIKMELTALDQLIRDFRTGAAPPHLLSEYRKYKAGSEIRKKQVAKAHREYNRAKSLYERSVISESEFEESKLFLKRSELTLMEFDQDHLKDWSLQKLEVSARIKNLQKDSLLLLQNLKDAHIIAPVAGSVTDLKDHEPGEFVTRGQELGEIIRNSTQQLYCYVDPIAYSRMYKEHQTILRIPGLDSKAPAYLNVSLDYDSARISREGSKLAYKIPGTVVLDATTESLRNKMIAGLPIIILVKIDQLSIYDLLFERLLGTNIRLVFQKPAFSMN